MNKSVIKIKRILALLIAAAVIFVSGCNKKENANMPPQAMAGPREGGVLNLAAYSPDTLNPLATEFSCVRDYLYLAYEGLFTVNSDLTVNGVLAESYTASEHNTLYEITLKKGVRFHDGSAFSSKDVVSTFEYIKMYETKYANALENVKTFRAKGDYKVEIVLNSSQANFITNLDFPILASGLEAEDFTLPNKSYKMNGTGRYRYKKTNEYVNMIFEKNPDWHSDTKVYIPQVNIRFVNNKDAIAYAFSSGETDMVTTEMGRWGEFTHSAKHNEYEVTTTQYAFVGINTVNTAFADVELRRTLASCIDKKNIVDSIMFSHAIVAETPITARTYFYRNDGEKTEYEKANVSQRRLSTYILYNEESQRKENVAMYLKKALEEEGIKVELTKVDFETYLNKIKSGDYQLYIGEVDMKRDCDMRFMFNTASTIAVPEGESVVVKLDGTEEPRQPAEDIFVSENLPETLVNTSSYISNYTDPRLDDIIGNITAGGDEESLKVAFNNLRAFYEENVPQIPLFHINEALFVSSRIKGKITPNLTNLFSDLGEIYIETYPDNLK